MVKGKRVKNLSAMAQSSYTDAVVNSIISPEQTYDEKHTLPSSGKKTLYYMLTQDQGLNANFWLDNAYGNTKLKFEVYGPNGYVGKSNTYYQQEQLYGVSLLSHGSGTYTVVVSGSASDVGKPFHIRARNY